MGPEQMSEEDKAAKIAELEGEPSTVAQPQSLASVDSLEISPIASSQSSAPGVSTTPKKRFKLTKKLIIIIAGAVLLLGGGSAWAYYAFVFQNPTNVVFDAVSNYFKASNTSTKTIIKTSSPINLGDKKVNVRLELDSSVTNAPSFESKAKLVMTIDGKSIELKGEVKFVESGSMFFRIDDLEKAVKDTEVILGTSVSGEYTDILKKIQNKWVEISADNLKKISAESSKTYQCVVDVLKKYKDDQSMLDIYKQHSFLSIKDSLGVRDGNTGYKVELNKDAYREFSKAVDGTPLQKDLNACYGVKDSSESIADTSADSLPDNIDMSVSLWINQWNHQLNKAEMTTKINGGDSGVDYAIDGSMDFTYGASVQPAVAPTGAVSVYDWIMEAFGPMYADIQGRAASASQFSSSNVVAKKAEAYYAITSQYPASIAAFAEYPETKIDSSITVVGNLAKVGDVITYAKCAVGAQVAYYDSTTSAYKIINIGEAKYTSQTSLCK